MFSPSISPWRFCYSERVKTMRTVQYAATRYGYCVQIVQDGEIVLGYSAGNCLLESQTVVAPRSRNAISLCQLKRWARETADGIARKQRISRVRYDPDLEKELREEDAGREEFARPPSKRGGHV